jgi:GTP-binding protein
LFIRYAPVVFVSAVTKKGVTSLLETIQDVYANYQLRISTHELNDALQDAFFQQQPPIFQGGRLSLKYATQVATAPPTIVLFVNDPEYAHFSYMRFLENQFRAHWPIPGSPIQFVLRKRA